jgi:hypothetical protein
MNRRLLKFCLAGAAAGMAPALALAGTCGEIAGVPPTATKCVTAIDIPGNPLRSYDISWVNPQRAEYYLGDRSNGGIDVIDTKTLKFKRTIGGFVGAKIKPNNTVDNAHSGPDGVVSHGRWLYAGDGDSTLKVIDLDDAKQPIKATISTGGKTRLDELDVTTDGKFVLAANNAEDPPFATLFTGNGDAATNSVKIVAKLMVDPAIVPAGAELSLEQPAWDPATKRFYTSIPVIAENPPGCNYKEEKDKEVTCHGGVLVTDPAAPAATAGKYDPKTRAGVIALADCGPNGATAGPNGNIMFGCTEANNKSDKTTLVMNGFTTHQTHVGGIVSSDEVFYNKGDQRYYTGSGRMKPIPALGVVGADNMLIEIVPISTGSHSVAADSTRNLIFVPQSAAVSVVGPGADTSTNGESICGHKNGCIAVYKSGKSGK